MPYAVALTDDEIRERLNRLSGWDREGDSIVKTYRCRYADGLALITRAVIAQEKMDHHADIGYHYDSVRVTITTHAVGHRLTAKDFDLADRFDAAAEGLTR